MLNLSAFLSPFSKLFTKCSGLQETSILPQRGLYGEREHLAQWDSVQGLW